MIAKQVQGSSFSKVLNYVHHKSGAKGIGSNMIGKDPKTLTEEFRIASGLRPRVTKCVYHTSLSVSPNERLSDRQWLNIARSYLKGMDFNGNQYAVYRHTDTEHDHVHIIANRIKITDGSVVSDSWQYRKAEIVVRGLEERFNLSPTSSSFNRTKTSPTTGEMRRYKRTGEVIPRCELQRLIDETLGQNPSLEKFIDNLKKRGVSVRLRTSDEGEIEGISYKLNGVAFQGRQLGRDYSWDGLKSAFTNKIISRSQAKSPEVNEDIVSTLNSGKDDIPLEKSRYKNKYDNLAQYIRNLPNFEQSEPQDMDRAVVLLSLKLYESAQEAKSILTQSDTVRKWSQELPRDVFVNTAQEYIENIVQQSLQLLNNNQLDLN